MNSGQNYFPIRNEGFAHPSERPRRRKSICDKIFCVLLMCVCDVYAKDPATTANAEDCEKWIEHEIHPDIPFLCHPKIHLKANCLVSSTSNRNCFETRIRRRAALVFEVLASGTLDSSAVGVTQDENQLRVQRANTEPHRRRIHNVYQRGRDLNIECKVSQFWHILHGVNNTFKWSTDLLNFKPCEDLRCMLQKRNV